MKKTLAAMTAALLMVGLVSSVALAAPKSPNNWTVYNFNANRTNLVATPATTFTAGVGFDFLSTPSTALLTNGQDATLLGNLTGRTITATFTITGSTPVFSFGGTSTCGTPPSVRLYFTGNAKGLGYYARQWWSNPAAYTLADTFTAGTETLTVSLDPALWSDWNGQVGNTVPNFTTAVANVTSVGVSFGGGCGFANGVGVSSGSASFILTSFTLG